MKRLGRYLILTLVLAFAITTGSFAVAEEQIQYMEEAEALEALGMFKGTNKGFELDREATRTEGIIMLIRMIGKEEEALASSGEHPFTDVPSWADSYVGYAYENDLTKGVSSDKFGTYKTLSADQYFTFILRALGYDDGNGDFLWYEGINKAQDVGIIDEEEESIYESDDKVFLRDDCAGASYNALQVEMKNENITMAEFLVEEGAFEESVAIELGIIEETEEEIIEIEWDGDIAYLPVTSEEEDRLYISGKVIKAAFPTANRVEVLWSYYEDIDEWSESAAEEYPFLLIEDSTVNQLSDGAYEMSFPKDSLTNGGAMTCFIYDKEFNILGCLHKTEAFKDGTETVAIDTSIPFDYAGIKADTWELLESHTGELVYFDNEIILTDQALDSSGSSSEYEIQLDLLSDHFDDVYAYAQGSSDEGYTDEEAAQARKWYTIFINWVNEVDYNFASGSNQATVWLNTDPDVTNIIFLTDSEGTILGYTLVSVPK